MAPLRRHLCVIFNPTAGARRKRRLERVLAALDALGAKPVLLETRAAGDAEVLAQSAARHGYDAVVAAGGDGTVNEVVNGLGDADIPLGIVPLGTANVLAAELELATEPEALAEVIACARVVPVFAGSANGRRFLMMAGIGFDARVVEGIDLAWKRAAGKAAYVASALGCLARLKAARYEVEIDGAVYGAASLVIAKGHYYGGRFIVAAGARLEEPVFEVALFEHGSRFDVLRYAAALGANRVAALDDARIVRGTRVRVTGPVGERVQIDGDLGAALPLEVTIAPRPLSLLR
ncbi:MAG TPA: diacylglycerol kinase family protein [Stellaceae bacterium]|nr:diacylglycerol kinase family protein [Stellaceae bacterium]